MLEEALGRNRRLVLVVGSCEIQKLPASRKSSTSCQRATSHVRSTDDEALRDLQVDSGRKGHLVHEAVDELEKALGRNRRLVLVVGSCEIRKLSADDFAIGLYQGRDVTGHN